MKGEIVAELNALRAYCEECDVKVNNGPVKLIRDHTNYVSELENRVSDLEPLCERLKGRTLEFENENRQLLDKVEELTSSSCGVVDGNQLRSFEEEYENKIKIIVTDYESQLLQKDKEYETLQSSTSGKTIVHRAPSSEVRFLYFIFLFWLSLVAKDMAAMSNETKEILQSVEEELTLKQDALEKLLEKQQQDVDVGTQLFC
jgi:hypothetical protein